MRIIFCAPLIVLARRITERQGVRTITSTCRVTQRRQVEAGREQGCSQHDSKAGSQSCGQQPAPCLFFSLDVFKFAKYFTCGLFYNRRRGSGAVFHIGAQQGAVAEDIDQPRHTIAQAIEQPDTLVGKQLDVLPGDSQAVIDIGPDLFPVKRLQMVARGNALRQLAHFRAGEYIEQFGLAENDNLQQFALMGFQIGQQAQLFQYRCRQILCLVDNKYGFFIITVAFNQELVNQVGIGFYAVAGFGVRDFQFVADGFQQFDFADLGVEQQGDVGLLGYLFQQAAADGGLAGADFAGQQYAAAITVQAVNQMRQRLAMLRRHVQITRIGGDGKRRLPESKIVVIHD